MPYIKDQDAERLQTITDIPTTHGELNYLYTCLYVEIWKQSPNYNTWHRMSATEGNPFDGPKTIADHTRAFQVYHSNATLETARREALAEFRRRVIAPYEDAKRKEAGRVDPYKILGLED